MKNLHDEIEARVQKMIRMVEKRHGKAVGDCVNHLLDEFITSAVEEATAHNLHPGMVISAFIEVIMAIERGSEEIAFRVQNIRDN